MIRKFHASTTREALRQVRDALGADAIILSNRQVAGGVEIMAVADMDVAALTAQQLQFATARVGDPVAPRREPTRLPAEADPRPPRPVAREAQAPPPPPVPQAPAAQVPAAAPAVPEMPPTPNLAAVPPAPAAPAAVPPPNGAEAMSGGVSYDEFRNELFREIRFLRGLLEGQLAGLAWTDLRRRDPAKLEIMRRMLSAGFSATLGRQLLDKMPEGCDFERGFKWVKAALAHNLHAVSIGEDLVERGGVYALVGPTGVGKTTTVAKLAARCTLRHGAAKLALLTTDSYRIGAHDQLRIYGRILGVPVYSIKDESDLQLTLADLKNRHLVLIDTVGMSQRDRRLADQVALLCGDGREVKRLLLISAVSQGNTLDDVVRSYQGTGMSGCILTKVDEAVGVGSGLDVIIRHRLSLHYVTNGQRVPEDLHLANSTYLVDRAFKSGQEQGPFGVEEAEAPLLMATDFGSQLEEAESRRLKATRQG